MNVRCGNRIALAIDSGVDLPYIAYQDILNEPVVPVDDYPVGTRWIDLICDFAGFSYYRKTEQLGLWEWMRSALGAESHAYFTTDDPVPFFAHVCRTAKNALFSLYR